MIFLALLFAPPPEPTGIDARLIAVGLVFPIVVGVVVWAITGRRKDQVAVAQVLATLPKAAAEGEVAQETVDAAIELADIATLQAHVAAMSAAFREERESLSRRLEQCATEVANVRGTVDELRDDDTRQHRELLDMFRRDDYHARALQTLAGWLAENLPKLRALDPTIPDPPEIVALPPLYVPDDEGPRRRWSDDTESR